MYFIVRSARRDYSFLILPNRGSTVFLEFSSVQLTNNALSRKLLGKKKQILAAVANKKSGRETVPASS